MSVVGLAPYILGLPSVLMLPPPNALAPLTISASAAVPVAVGPAASSHHAVPEWTINSAIPPAPYRSPSAVCKRAETYTAGTPFFHNYDTFLFIYKNCPQHIAYIRRDTALVFSATPFA